MVRIPFHVHFLCANPSQLQKIGGGPMIQPTPQHRALYYLLMTLLAYPAYALTKVHWIPFTLSYILLALILNKILFGIWFPHRRSLSA